MPKILIVDDQEPVLRIMRMLLERENFEVIDADGGEAALRVISGDEKIDLMIIDMKMPGITGIEVAKKAREMGKTFPILFQTGNLEVNGDEDKELERIGVAMNDILCKPVEFSDVLAKIKEKLYSSDNV